MTGLPIVCVAEFGKRQRRLFARVVSFPILGVRRFSFLPLGLWFRISGFRVLGFMGDCPSSPVSCRAMIAAPHLASGGHKKERKGRLPPKYPSVRVSGVITTIYSTGTRSKVLR